MADSTYMILTKGKKSVFYGPIPENVVSEAKRNFYLNHTYALEIPKPPSKRTLRRWKQYGKMRSIDGCTVQGLCSCEHGQRSWLALFKAVKDSK